MNPAWKAQILSHLRLTGEHFGLLIYRDVPHIKSGLNKIDGFVKSLKTSFDVIPAKAGIQCFQIVLNACLRRHDGISDFLRVRQNYII